MWQALYQLADGGKELLTGCRAVLPGFENTFLGGYLNGVLENQMVTGKGAGWQLDRERSLC
jgi:hypothetical protein